MTLNGNEVNVGDTPFMLSAYDETGENISSGMFTLSTDLNNVILDLRELPLRGDPWSPKLGLQLKGEEQTAIVSVRMRKSKQVFLDKSGVSWPDDITKIDTNGQTITLTFLSPDNNVISLDSLSVSVKDQIGIALRTDVLKHEILRVSGVPKQLLTINVSDGDKGKTWSTKLFPKFRGAGKDIILYTVLNVPVGRSLESDPTYE